MSDQFPTPPETGRLRQHTSQHEDLLQHSHPDDASDVFANDPDAEVSHLGKLALRRDDPDDYFELTDLCAARLRHRGAFARYAVRPQNAAGLPTRP